jgi:1-carboxybiuret hydrolase subunit AtzH-like protein
VEAMNRLFWDSPLTLGYGQNGTLIGHQAIAANRRARKGKGVQRELRDTIITTFGCDFAVANTEGVIGDRIHRRSQTRVSFAEGWRIVSAHVSDEPRL